MTMKLPSPKTLGVLTLACASLWPTQGASGQAIRVAAPRTQVANCPPRAFRLGFTTWSSDCTQPAVDAAWQRVEENGDLLCIMMHGGVPWPEAFAGQPYSAQLENALTGLALRSDTDQALLLQVSCLDMLRSGPAEYWGAQENMALPAPWDGYDFGDPQLALAYSNWLLDLIARLDPDYLVYGMEVSEYLLHAPSKWPEFVAFTAQVSAAVRGVHPELSLGVSVVLGDPAGPEAASLQAGIPALLPHVDHLAASVYPYAFQGLGAGGGDPKNLHSDWLRTIEDLAGGKPVAISETGFIAQDLDLGSQLYVPGTTEWQASYVARLLREAHDLRALYVVWFASMDFDALWTNCLGQDPLARIWRDTGLFDELGNARPAFAHWRAWQQRSAWPRLHDYGFLKSAANPIDFQGATAWFDATHLPADPDVILVDGVFRMYLTLPSNPNFNPVLTGLAESPDGEHFSFVRDETNPVLELSELYEAHGIETVALVESPEGFAAYYTTYEQAHPLLCKIGRAHSSDGSNFVKDGIVLSESLPWDQAWTAPDGQTLGGLLEQTVVWDPQAGQYTMLYNTFGLIGGAWTLPLGRATSPDGFTWSKDSAPVVTRPDLDPEWDHKAIVHPDLLLVDGLWIMAYFAADLQLDAGQYITSPGTIRIAFSSDGITWRAARKNIAIAPEGAGWEAHSTFSPSLVLGPDGETLHLYYWGVGGPPGAQTWNIGHATKPLDELRVLARDLLDATCR